MEKNKIEKIRKAGIVSIILVGLISSLLILDYMAQPVIEEQIIVGRQREWRALGDGDPGGDNSGFMYYMHYPHQTEPATAYASNLSNATAYEFSDVLDAEMQGETPHSVFYDKVMKFRVNDTVGYNTSSSTWEIDWVRANITCDFDYASDLSDVSFNIILIASNADFAWYHAWLQDADGDTGTGFQITHNEKFDITELKAQGFW